MYLSIIRYSPISFSSPLLSDLFRQKIYCTVLQFGSKCRSYIDPNLLRMRGLNRPIRDCPITYREWTQDWSVHLFFPIARMCSFEVDWMVMKQLYIDTIISSKMLSQRAHKWANPMNDEDHQGFDGTNLSAAVGETIAARNGLRQEIEVGGRLTLHIC
jgi:hypothetical protein